MSLPFESVRRAVVPVKQKYFDIFAREKNKIQIKKSMLSVFVFALIAIPIMPIKTEALSSDTIDLPKIELATNAQTPVVSVNKISTIVPGESLAQKETREKAEAEVAKAKALVETKVKRSALAVAQKQTFNDPSNFDEIYAKAGAVFGVDPKLLKAIHIVETGASGSTYRSNPSGATGPMQFLPSTFRRHAVDGDGDGIPNIGNVQDAIFSAAKYLCDCGYPNIKKALWGYNPSNSYFAKVTRIANGL